MLIKLTSFASTLRVFSFIVFVSTNSKPLKVFLVLVGFFLYAFSASKHAIKAPNNGAIINDPAKVPLSFESSGAYRWHGENMEILSVGLNSKTSIARSKRRITFEQDYLTLSQERYMQHDSGRVDPWSQSNSQCDRISLFRRSALSHVCTPSKSGFSWFYIASGPLRTSTRALPRTPNTAFHRVRCP